MNLNESMATNLLASDVDIYRKAKLNIKNFLIPSDGIQQSSNYADQVTTRCIK